VKAQTVDEQQDDDLVRTVRQKSQLELAFPPRATGEARNAVGEASEIRTARAGPESSIISADPPYTRSVRTVVWEGGAARLPPIPIAPC